jgi:hypothetical protein
MAANMGRSAGTGQATAIAGKRNPAGYPCGMSMLQRTLDV